MKDLCVTAKTRSRKKEWLIATTEGTTHAKKNFILAKKSRARAKTLSKEKYRWTNLAYPVRPLYESTITRAAYTTHDPKLFSTPRNAKRCAWWAQPVLLQFRWRSLRSRVRLRWRRRFRFRQQLRFWLRLNFQFNGHFISLAPRPGNSTR